MSTQIESLRFTNQSKFNRLRIFLEPTQINRRALIVGESKTNIRRARVGDEGGRGLHQAVIDGYRRLAEENPKRVVTLDGTMSPEEIHRRIVREIQLRQANPLPPPDV